MAALALSVFVLLLSQFFADLLKRVGLWVS